MLIRKIHFFFRLTIIHQWAKFLIVMNIHLVLRKLFLIVVLFFNFNLRILFIDYFFECVYLLLLENSVVFFVLSEINIRWNELVVFFFFSVVLFSLICCVSDDTWYQTNDHYIENHRSTVFSRSIGESTQRSTILCLFKSSV